MSIDWQTILNEALRQQRDNNPLGNVAHQTTTIPQGGFPGGRAKTENSSIFGKLIDLGSGLTNLGRSVKDNPFGPYLSGPARIPGQPSIDPSAPQFNSSVGQVAGAAGQSDDIMTQLINSLSGGNFGIDPAQLEAQARSAASAQFDPQIAELQRAMQAAQTRAGRNKTELGNMFSALSNSYNADIPGINANYTKGKSDVAAQYKDLQNSVASQYADANKQQQDLMKQLNIQAAAPDLLAQQNTDKAFFQNQAKQSQQDTTDAMQMLQSGATDFARQGADTARLEGTEQQVNLMNQLEDYLQQATGQIGDLNIQKTNAFQSNLAQLTQQAQQFAYQQNQDQFQRLLDIAKLQQEQQQINNQTGSQYKQGPLAASQYLAQNSPNASQLNSLLLSVLHSPQITSGKQGSLLGETVPMTPEAAASLAQQQAASAGMDEQSQKDIYLAMLAYYGKLQ